MSNSHSNPSIETLKRDVRTLANDTVKAAQNNIVQPAVEAAHRAGDYARQAVRDSRERVNQQLAVAERYASQGYDRTTTWITANPLAAVGVALAAGLLISTLFRPATRR